MSQKSKVNLNKLDIARNISHNLGVPLSYSKRFLDNLINEYIDEIVNSNSLTIKNLATFKIVIKNERDGRNPKTKEIYKINKRKSISFKVAEYLKIKVNK